MKTRWELSGAAFCVVSALAYTMMNVCMRQLTVLQCDPMWAVFNRELVTTVAVAPWLLCRAIRGRQACLDFCARGGSFTIKGDSPIFADTKIGTVPGRPALPWGSTLAQLLAVGVLMQVGGNIGVQWAYGVVGLAVTVPVVFGANIAGSALLGRACLGEHVSRRSMTAIAMLFASLILLGIGVETARTAHAASTAALETSGRLVLALGVAAATVAGIIYSMLNIVIRRSVTQTTSPMAVAFLVPLSGVLSLGTCILLRRDVPPSLGSPCEQFSLMTAAGLFNVVGFLSLIHGLKRTTVIHANAISTSQVAMAAVVGVALFAERPNPWLIAGICLTIAAVLRIDRPAETPEL